MKVKQRKREDDNLILEATATPQEVNRVLNQAHEGFARAMGMQPDPNKTVAQAVFEQMGIRDLDSMVADSAMQMLIPLALDKRNIIPAYPPSMEAAGPIKRDKEFKFQLNVALRPEYELTSYEPVTIEVDRFSVDEREVDAEIAQLVGSYTTYVKDEDASPDHEVEPGDYVKIKLEATEGGKRMEGLSADGRIYAAGAGHMPKGFDDNVLGMKVGETKQFTFEAPGFDDEMNEVTQIVEAEVTIQEMLKESKPEIDDAWVKLNMPHFKDAETLRGNIRKSIELRNRDAYENYLRQAVASELAKRFDGKIADEVYEGMRDQLVNNIKLNLQQQGKTWEEFVEENGGESQINMMIMLQARDILTQGYALDAIFRHFNLSVSNHDIEQVCHAMNPNANPKELHQQIIQNGQGFALRESAERYKANQYALDNAIIEYVD